MKAVWNGETIAESDDIVTVEGNAYFPAAALRSDVVRPSDHDQRLPLERHGQVLLAGGRWEKQPECRLVLSRAEGGRGTDPRSRRLLERRDGQHLA
jgi:hypothetical protein